MDLLLKLVPFFYCSDAASELELEELDPLPSELREKLEGCLIYCSLLVDGIFMLFLLYGILFS